MDLPRRRREGSSSCFPRTRGDGPFLIDGGVWAAGFPPHSRGWTLEGHGPVRLSHVSPALAGMDPSRASSRARRPSFPRTRGDGPRLPSSPAKWCGFPPHSRGWTRRDPPFHVIRHVSPALAGMDPRPSRSTKCNSSFPRTRGDGPLGAPMEEAVVRFPPHSRGWTSIRPPSTFYHYVSPALAGMDRFTVPSGLVTTSFPRTRGDGPLNSRWKRCAPKFPPHSRGWTHRHAIEHVSAHVSPHSRGWTASYLEISGQGFVSPALAGMDPLL